MYATERERVGREEYAVDVLVAVVYVVDFALQSADTVLQNVVLKYKFAILVVDGVEFRRVEEVRHGEVDERNDDETEQNLAQQRIAGGTLATCGVGLFYVVLLVCHFLRAACAVFFGFIVAKNAIFLII